MNEKEAKRTALLSIRSHLNAAMKECDNIDELKELQEKIKSLLAEHVQEMMKMAVKDPELI